MQSQPCPRRCGQEARQSCVFNMCNVLFCGDSTIRCAVCAEEIKKSEEDHLIDASTVVQGCACASGSHPDSYAHVKCLAYAETCPVCDGPLKGEVVDNMQRGRVWYSGMTAFITQSLKKRPQAEDIKVSREAKRNLLVLVSNAQQTPAHRWSQRT